MWLMKVLARFSEEVVYPLRYAQWYHARGNGYDFAGDSGSRRSRANASALDLRARARVLGDQRPAAEAAGGDAGRGAGMRIGRMIGRGFAVLAVVGLFALGVALWTQRDIPAAELEARYGGPPSKFIIVDGVRFHYRDEGSGPVVVLLHANFSNLLDWEPWVEVLKDRYRVVRLDMTSHGLTGPDPTGDYTLPRTLKLTADFIDALGLQKVTLAGISLGGTVAIHYTAAHPERVERLVLLNPGSLEGKEKRARGGVPKAGYVLKYLLPRALPRFMLASGFGDPAKLPESLVDRWYDLWLREGQREAQLDRLSQYKAGDIEGLIRSLRVPVLLMWGEDNQTAAFSQSATFLELLKGASAVKFIAYPGLGHMALEEDGARLGRDVRAWLEAQEESKGDATL
jgi:pimeloyl-ACP methyl ester carboxylesterase